VAIFYKTDASAKVIDATDLPLENLTLKATQESARVTVERGNNQLALTRSVEVLKDVKFAVFSLSLECLGDDAALQYVRVVLHANGTVFQLEQTLGFLEEKACAQIIFVGNQPLIKIFRVNHTNYVELLYNLGDAQKAEVKMIIGGFEVEKVEDRYVKSLLANMVCSWSRKEASNFPIRIFDYREVLKKITFIACQRGACVIERFVNDPMFNLVYINDRVAVFKVREQNG
jgi:hypothetical protein